MKDAKTESVDVLLSKLSLLFFAKVMACYSERAKDFLRRLLDIVEKLAERSRCKSVHNKDLTNRLAGIVQFATEVSV